MDANEPCRPQVGPGLERFFGRDMDRAGNRAWRVGAYGQGGQVEGPQRVSDLLEVRIIAGISREIEALGAQHRPRSPEPAALIDKRAPRAVLGGSADDGQALDLDGLTPIQLDRVRDAAVRQPGSDSQGHHEGRIEDLRESPDGW